jgi:diguanylate cyclase (GGDEF)-like protein
VSTEFDQFASLAATLCGTAGSAVTLLGAEVQSIKGCVGVDRSDIPIEQSFCRHTVQRAGRFEVLDAAADDTFKANPLVTRPDGIRFYAGVPLPSSEGGTIGALCVVDPAPRPAGLSAEQWRALEMLAAQASLQLRLQQIVAERDAAVYELRRANDDLKWAAHHDHMTGLGNRALLRQVLSDIAATAACAGLLAIDVDHFKRINDSFGHEAGDALLKEIGRRLSRSVREGDLVMRVGGDEFVVLTRDVEDEAQLDSLARRLLDAMRTPFRHKSRVFDCRITIGGARWQRGAADLNSFVRFADAALYEAKARGRGRYVSFEPRMVAEQSRRLGEIARARAALAGGWVRAFYQPKVDIADGSVVGLEALLRIVEPGCPAEQPEAITAAFDEPELAQAIGAAMLTEVLGDLRRWRSTGVDVGRVAVNLSAVEIGDPTFADRLLAALDQHGVPPTALEIEIVENILLDGRSDAMLATVRTLSAAGVTVAFDDFGTGYAALAHLPKYPVNVLKIDKSFVARLDLRSNQAIVSAMLSMATELGIEVIAEGVESVGQAAELLRLGCTLAQGFLYSPAVPAVRVASLIRERPRRRRAGPALADWTRLASHAA